MKQIHEDKGAILWQSASSYTIIKKWAAEFKCGWESIDDDSRSGRSSTSTTQENIEKICDLIIGDRRLKIREIVETVSISYELAQNIVNKLGFSKVSARWVPRLFSVIQNPELTHVFSRLFRAVWCRSTRIFGQVCDRGWIMGSPLYSRIKTTIQTLEKSRITPSKESVCV